MISLKTGAAGPVNEAPVICAVCEKNRASVSRCRATGTGGPRSITQSETTIARRRDGDRRTAQQRARRAIKRCRALPVSQLGNDPPSQVESISYEWLKRLEWRLNGRTCPPASLLPRRLFVRCVYFDRAGESFALSVPVRKFRKKANVRRMGRPR